jgi:lambda repressor-like predicted transcriptional regulator
VRDQLEAAQHDINLSSLVSKLRAEGFKLRFLSFRPGLEDEYLSYFLVRKRRVIQGSLIAIIISSAMAMLAAWPFYHPRFIVKVLQMAMVLGLVGCYRFLNTQLFLRHHRSFAHGAYVGFSVLMAAMLSFRNGDLHVGLAAFYFVFSMAIIAIPAIGQVQFVALVNVLLSYFVTTYMTDLHHSSLYGSLTSGVILTVLLGMLVAVHSDVERRSMFLTEREILAEKDWSDRLLHCLIPARFSRRLFFSDRATKVFAEHSKQAYMIVLGLDRLSEYLSKIPPSDAIAEKNRLLETIDHAMGRAEYDFKFLTGDHILLVFRDSGVTAQKVLDIAERLFATIKPSLASAKDLNDPLVMTHCGQVSSGVVGTKRFHFDMWGHDIELLSRMVQSKSLYSQSQTSILCTQEFAARQPHGWRAPQLIDLQTPHAS